jgi:hypothetical protein
MNSRFIISYPGLKINSRGNGFDCDYTLITLYLSPLFAALQ